MLRISLALVAASLAGSSFAAEPIATTDGESQGTSLQVTELKASDSSVTLRFTIRNDGDGDFNPDSLADDKIEHSDRQSISGVYLLDQANKKKYLVIYDTNHLCICSRESHDVHPKTSANFWAKFPPVPADVAKIGVVVPHFVPMDDVPLTR
jgi:hypothetical protein